MSKVLGLVNFIPIIFATFFLLYYIRFMQNEFVSFDEWVLEKQVNYAADSAVDAMLSNSPDIDTSYSSGEQIDVDPNVGVRDYSEILALSFQLPISDQTVHYIQSRFIKTLLICAYDGIYAYWSPMKVDTVGTSYFMGTPKIPYFYSTAGNATQYQINLNYDSGYAFSSAASAAHYYTGDPGDQLTVDDTKVLDSSGAEHSISKLPEVKQRIAINQQVADVLNYSISKAYEQVDSAQRYQLPDIESDIRGSQPIQSVSVVGIVEGESFSSFTPVIAGSIGGARIIGNDPVLGLCVYKNSAHDDTFAGYIRTSDLKKYGKGPIGSSDDAIGSIFGYDYARVDDVFDNVFDAALGKNSSARPDSSVPPYLDLIGRFGKQ